MEGYMTIKETSKKWGVSERRINTLCHGNRVGGCMKFGSSWAIPADARKQKDKRVKRGRYIKEKTNDYKSEGKEYSLNMVGQ